MKKSTMKAVIKETCFTVSEEKLFKAVVRQFGNWADFFDRPEDFRDASCGVNGFIYYDDTERFAKRNIETILDVVQDFEEETGMIVKMGENKLNFLAWFALETIVQKVIVFKEDN